MSTTDLEQPPAQEAPSAAATPAPSAPAPPQPAPRKFYVRTHYVINWKAQFRGSMWSILIVVGMLVLVNVMFYYLGSVNAEGTSPQWQRMQAHADSIRRTAVTVLSVFFLFGFILLRILETHKVHGAAFNLHRRLGQLADGRYNVFAKLRDGDDLQPLADGINDVAGALRERTRRNVESLEELAARAGDLGPIARDVESGLKDLLAQERALLE